MTWEQKFAALGALARMCTDVSLFMRKPGDWGVLIPHVERKEGAVLSGGGLNGKDPESAVESAWQWATDSKFYLVIKAFNATRRAVKWNGFMWVDVEETTR